MSPTSRGRAGQRRSGARRAAGRPTTGRGTAGRPPPRAGSGPPPLHRKAALSLVLALLGLPFFLFLPSGPAWPFLVPPLEICAVTAVILGVASLREIERAGDTSRNRRMAVAGTAFGCIGAAGFTLILVLLVLPGTRHSG